MRSLLLALTLLLTASAADAQRRGHAIAKQGDLAITAVFNGFSSFTISPLEGGVGLRYWTGDRTVLGTSLAVGGEDSSTESTDVIPFGDSEVTRFNESSIERQSASLSLWVEQHVGRRRSTVSPFVGASVRIGVNDDESTRLQEQTCGAGVPGCDDQTTLEVNNQEILSIGGGLLIGGEVKIVNGVTLSGAYTLGATYSDAETLRTAEVRQDGVTTFEDEDLTTREGWQFGVGTTRVALSLYF